MTSSSAACTPVNAVHPMRKITNIRTAGQSIFRAGKRYLQKFPSFDVDDGVDSAAAACDDGREFTQPEKSSRRHSLTLHTIESLDLETADADGKNAKEEGAKENNGAAEDNQGR